MQNRWCCVTIELNIWRMKFHPSRGSWRSRVTPYPTMDLGALQTAAEKALDRFLRAAWNRQPRQPELPPQAITSPRLPCQYLPDQTLNSTSAVENASSKEEKDCEDRKGRQEGTSRDLDSGRIVTTACRPARASATLTKTDITITTNHNSNREGTNSTSAFRRGASSRTSR